MKFAPAIVALSVLVSPIAAPKAAVASEPPQAQCYADWSDAVDVIRRESLTSVRDLHLRAKERHVGDVVRVTLCTEGGVYTYKLLIREPKGRVTALTVSAVRPFDPAPQKP